MTRTQASRSEPAESAPRLSASYITGALSPTAARILAAAQRVLRRDGYSGLTLQRVAAEAGEHKSLVIYHFGSKAALIGMLVDSLWHDLDVDLFQSVKELPADSERRISALIEAQRRLGDLTDQQLMYVDLFAGLTRQADARQHLGQLNRSYRDLHQDCLTATGLAADALTALAGLVLAVGDGMAVSLLVRPGDVDDSGVYRLLEDMVLSLARQTRRGGPTGPMPRSGSQPPPESWASAAGAAVLGPDPLDGLAPVVLGPDPLDGLAPVARKLVRGARTVLHKRGFHALTLDAVGRQAGEPPSSITYYFGDKKGLITALIEAQFYEQRTAAARMFLPSGEGHDCVVGAICAARVLLTDMTSFRVFYDLLPVVSRDARFRDMQAAHDRWLAGVITAGLHRSDVPEVVDHAPLLAVLGMAAADGLAMQVLSDPKGFDPRPSCAMLERLVNDHAPGRDRGGARGGDA